MNKLKEAEIGETAIEIINLALSLHQIHSRYSHMAFADKVNIAIKILELYETRAIRINLIEIDNSLTEIDSSFNNLTFAVKYK